MDSPIISPDTQRKNRIPPNQALTRKWPILHDGEVPPFDPDRWDFAIGPSHLVDPVKRFTWTEFTALPRVEVHADMHCVTRWSKLDNRWGGVSVRELLKNVRISESARYVMIHCEYGFTTNLPIEWFMGEDCLFALEHDGRPLDPDHGYPVRLVIPRLYAWKSAKWVRGIEFMSEDRAGFWEQWDHGGYHMVGDPWKDQRFRPDE